MDVPLDAGSYARVLKLARTPGWEEFSRIALVAGIGIALTGLMGFVVFLVMSVLPS